MDNFKKLWETLYILAICFKPDNQLGINALIGFFHELPFVFPDPNISKLIKQFILLNPIEDNICKCKRHVRWLVDLNNYICLNLNTNNKDDYDTICKLYDIKTITKKKWGNSAWFFIHYISLRQDTSEKIFHFKRFMYYLAFILPCDKCRNHLQSHMLDIPLDSYSSNSKDLFEWTFILHNTVNKSLGKKMISFEEAIHLYN